MKTLLISYQGDLKSTGKPIIIQDVKTDKKTFTDSISGSGDLIMAYNSALKKSTGKICVLQIDNFKAHSIDSSKLETIRLWFCKGNFNQFNKGKLNANYSPNEPIVKTDANGKNRQNIKSIELKNVQFEISFNNAKWFEKKSRATSILRVFN